MVKGGRAALPLDHPHDLRHASKEDPTVRARLYGIAAWSRKVRCRIQCGSEFSANEIVVK